MSRLLAIDVGAGTMDVLFLDTESGDQFKSVVKSPTRTLAEKILACQSKRIVLTGRQMGGGPVAEAIRIRARDSTVMMTRSAAETIHHRMEKIKELGVSLISPKQARQEAGVRDTAYYKTGDILARDVMTILRSMGVETRVDVLGIAVQDHGTPKERISSLDFRHRIFKEVIERSPKPSAFLFESDRVPAYLCRMKAAAAEAKRIASRQVYLMDTGMAAILGASSDPSARGKGSVIVLDIATSHTLGALLEAGEIGGFFEYHTHALTPEILRCLVIDLAEGRLSHERIVSEGGHGAYIRRSVGFDRVEMILATGPKRKFLEQVSLDDVVLGAPFGDNMMTGTAGLVLAMTERMGIPIG